LQVGHHRHPPSFPTRRSSDLLVIPSVRRKPVRPARPWSLALALPLTLSALSTLSACGAPAVSSSDICGKARPLLTLVANSGPERSEEHTSELQSRENLVCRLL